MLENGATTLWDHWAFSDDIYSQDHPMFARLASGFYKALAGIKPASEAVGFDQLIIAPQPVAGFEMGQGPVMIQCAAGLWSDWNQVRPANFHLRLCIPVGLHRNGFSCPQAALPESPKAVRICQPTRKSNSSGMENHQAILNCALGAIRFHVHSSLIGETP